MSTSTECTHNTDPLKLVREGTNQEQRLFPALDPAYAPVDERTHAHRMVFAQAYSQYLKYFGSDNAEAGDWQPFFSQDVSALLAVAAVQDVSYYRQNVKEFADFLNNRQNEHNKTGLRDHLDYLFSCCATLAIRLDLLKEKLPPEIPLGKALQNLVQSQLAPALKRLIAYRRGGENIADGEKPVNDTQAEKAAVEILDGNQVHFRILGANAVKFHELSAANLSRDWTSGGDWASYCASIAADDSVFGSLAGTNVFDRVNHIATHNLFTSILDQFLKVYARTVDEAKRTLEKSFKEWDRHEPHFALFLAFLRLFEHARTEANTLTGRHLDFYYREILRLKEKSAEPGHAHLLVELARQVESHEIKTGQLFKAGKDNLGRDAFFANDREFVANQAKVAALKSVYRQQNNSPNDTLPFQNTRLFASPVANSDDGLGAELTSVDQSWHPFYNKIYQDGRLADIKMPKAEIGFAIASHYLLMAEGKRTVTVEFTSTATGFDHKDDVMCLFTGKKEWIEIAASKFVVEDGTIKLEMILTGTIPAVVPYSAKIHGYNFATNLPVLLVKLRHRDKVEYPYHMLKDVEISNIDLTVNVQRLKTLAVSNDYGPVDTSKPFQPFGSAPVENSALVIGSVEVFQKTLSVATLNVQWQATPEPFRKNVDVFTEYLNHGKWLSYKNSLQDDITKSSFTLLGEPESSDESPFQDAPDLSKNEYYNNSSRYGFFRLIIKDGFGHHEYEQALIDYIRKVTGIPDHKTTEKVAEKSKIKEIKKPFPPSGPFVTELTVDYTATQKIALHSTDESEFEKRHPRFIHLGPFGQAEQHSLLNAAQKVYLFPQFDEAELYIGVTGLKPPQNLALLFQVTDGTADPLSEKPDNHISWSYLRGNEWMPFDKNDVEDRTGGLLNSGIVTLAVPRDSSDTNTLLPFGMHWIRASVTTEPDVVCRLRMIAAQALEATFTDKENDPAFPARVLQSGTISKLEQPVAAVKKVTQPFETFGGRGKEAPTDFYIRISERLRHKDRAIALWDYERLVLEAFPQIFRVKCLNHTQYEPNEKGTGIYKELAPGHVTVVTIPNQEFQNQHDPSRPYASLGLLKKVDSFLRKRFSCFIKLHVNNPKFEEVRVTCKVRLYDEFDETFYVKEMKKAITRFLSPWAFPGGGSPSFGGKIYRSVLINFVEDLEYVDYVTDFQLLHNDLPQAEVVEGSSAVSILVSARDHNIDPFKPAELETPPGEKCPCEA